MAPRLGEQPDAAILTLWERGVAAAPIERALLLAAEARPELAMQQCRALPLGQRDQAIAALRTRLFGPAAELASRCPHCGTEMEVVIADVARVFDDASALPPPPPRLQGLSLRAVTSEDLAAAEAAAARGKDLRAAIVERIATIGEGETVPELDASTLDAALESLDAAAELRFDLTCSDCGSQWVALFDIVDCTWRELDRAAGRIADEVAALASAYGWREAATLAMSRARRSLYLERIPG
jgi:hypothetical protein